MEETVALINQLIEEHKQILHEFQTIEQVANDVSAITQLDKTKEDFLPGRFNDQKQGLQNLQDSLETIDGGLQKHFDREEKQLSAALKQQTRRWLQGYVSYSLSTKKSKSASLNRKKR